MQPKWIKVRIFVQKVPVEIPFSIPKQHCACLRPRQAANEEGVNTLIDTLRLSILQYQVLPLKQSRKQSQQVGQMRLNSNT